MNRSLWPILAVTLLFAFACQPQTGGAPGMTGDVVESLPDDQVAAWVNSKPISVKRMDDMIAQMPPFMVQQLNNPQARRELVDNLVGVELVYGKAEAEGFANTPEMQTKIRELSKHLVYAEYIKAKVTVGLTDPTDEELKAFFDQTPQLAGQDFNAVKDQISQHLGRMKEQEVVQKFMDELRSKAEVKYNESVLGAGSPPSMPPMMGAPSVPNAAPSAPPAEAPKSE